MTTLIRLRRAVSRRMRQVPLKWIALCTTGLAAVLLGLSAFIRFGPIEQFGFVSSYGLVDNRLVLLRYALLLLAVALGPFVAALGVPARWRPVEPSGGRGGRGARGTPSPTVPGGAAKGGRPPADSAAAAGTPPPPVWILLRRSGAWLITAALLFLFFAGSGVAYRALNGHELVHFGYLDEISHGRLLNVDTRICYGPLQGYSLYWFMKLVSFTVYGFRLYWNVVTAAFLALLFPAIRPRFRSRALFFVMAAWLILHTTARYYMPDARGINGGFWGWGNVARQGWVPLALLLLTGPLKRWRVGLPQLLAGALAVIGYFYAQETLLPGVAALAIVVFLSRDKKPGRRLWLELIWLAGGALVAWLVVMAPVLKRNALPAFLAATYEVPRLFMKGALNLAYPSLLGKGAAGLLHALPYYGIPAIILGFLLLQWVFFLRDDPGWEIEFSLAAYAALSYLNVLVRADLPHLLNVTLPSLLLIFLCVDRWTAVAAAPAVSAAAGPPPAARAGPARRFGTRSTLAAAALTLPLLIFHPGLFDMARGLWGRVAHFHPAPPAGYVKIPLERAGIWTPADNWFDNSSWGGLDDPEAAGMIGRLSGGHSTFIIGNKASLYYFLSGAPCAIQYTDLPSQCFTRQQFMDFAEQFMEADPRYVFVMKSFADQAPKDHPRYHDLGLHHGFYVYQRVDLPAVPPSGF